jgi:ABC-type proline/glycine betaine transport system substrate-binding protein
MQGTIDKAAALDAISTAQTTNELDDARFEALCYNADIRHLTYQIAAKLLAEGYLDAMPMNNFGELCGQIKDAIIENILTMDLQHLLAVDTATRETVTAWHTPKQAARPDMSRYKGLVQDFLKAAEAIDKAAEE